ncbi:MAG: hypothetical protein HKO67_02080 [Flavobacteriaceae bacterium]|nr:hypothetical protein [Flavobacteriaceae bacterium]
MKNVTFVLLLVSMLFQACSTDPVVTGPAEQENRKIRSILVEKPNFPGSDFRITFDSRGRPIRYSDITDQDIFRSFQYNNNGQVINIEHSGPQNYIEEFYYENERLEYQTTLINQSEVLLEFIYSTSEIQVLRFIDDIYHSTIFFGFSDPEYEQLTEVRSYDGGGQLRHQYNLEYDDFDNIVLQEQYSFEPFIQEMVFNRRISQIFDQGINPLYDSDQPGWMPAWFMSHPESESFIENISRFSPNNVSSRIITNADGSSSNISYDYEYDDFGYPSQLMRITDGEFDIRKYGFEYYYN